MTSSAPSIDLILRSAFLRASRRMRWISGLMVRDGARAHHEGMLVRCGHQLLRRADHIGLRDQALHLWNARAAIGAGFQLHPDLAGRACPRRDGVAEGGTADAETGTDDRATVFEPVDGF